MNENFVQHCDTEHGWLDLNADLQNQNTELLLCNWKLTEKHELETTINSERWEYTL